MKRKLCTILTAVALFVSGSTTAYAADVSHSSEGVREEFGVEESLAETVTHNYYGTSYGVTFWESFSCQCKWDRNAANTADSVWAFTGYGTTSFVMITSKAYDDKGNVIGSNSNGGTGGTSMNYTAKDYVYYSYQVHSAPDANKEADLFLFRY